MRQIAHYTVHPPEPFDRTVTSLDLSGEDAIHVPAGYELHVKIEARPKRRAKPIRSRGIHVDPDIALGVGRAGKTAPSSEG